ncbi:hypothetical protein NBRC10512_005624 [Rhodotorula toruloides]|uniref:Uncharacterized protein n=1 Tax=Rhodotorula toruloides (strain NP11) TaxID=1130832 RepID=M7XNM4_RHOT1|nr:uncharacterized protein RHTO_03253 [Rhodotorula toruloides NP11]EMS25524.1 hypothetical protein RHTO_03253 [Rhodotorula toruloides NP11]
MAASTNVDGSSQAGTSMKRAHDSSSDSEECSDGAAGGRPGGKGKPLDASLVADIFRSLADLVNHMLSSRDFAEINFPEILGPDLFPMSASISLRQKGSRSVRDAATQTDSSFATSAPPQPACACNADNARLSILVPPCKVPTPQHSPSPLTAANAAPSLIYVTVDASLAAHLAPALPTLRAAGISSTIDIANAKQRLQDARREIRRR